jgi:hypothetical protein
MPFHTSGSNLARTIGAANRDHFQHFIHLHRFVFHPVLKALLTRVLPMVISFEMLLLITIHGSWQSGSGRFWVAADWSPFRFPHLLSVFSSRVLLGVPLSEVSPSNRIRGFEQFNCKRLPGAAC